jgi:cysteinyl-tRNA synthetase
MLQIYNSLTRTHETFTPIKPGKVGMYVCGMTVYDHAHVGHARVMIVFDVVARYLRSRGFDVRYVRNITDIDDKIIRRAGERGEDISGLTARVIDAMHEDERALGMLPPDEEPRATTHIAEIVAMIESLVNGGYAYRASNGDVYYRVRKFASYGALSAKSIDDLLVGARVEVGEAKEDPLDFVLWKAAKAGEPSWPSPWGPGRPGWHIECSAMSTHCLGESFDIHGGGMDLKFPHHENEIAQSEAATGHKFVNYWMHVGFVRINEEKMSKSLGNFFTVREVLAKFSPEVLRYFILASHYRSPLDYSDANLKAAKSALDGVYLALRDLDPNAAPGDAEHEARFHAAMDDDFNTPKAFAEFAGLATEINRAKSTGELARAASLARTLRDFGRVLGLFQADPETYFKGAGNTVDEESSGTSSTDVERLIEQRNAARKAKDFAQADRVRDQLQAAGVILEDGPGGTTWRRS